ncbi:MAG: TRAM domain-containing protein [Candidatus Micrarchaeia archaeon]
MAYREGPRRGGHGGGFGGHGGGFGGHGGGFGCPQREAPVHTGEEYDVEISDVSRRGEGIARIQGFIVFVAGAKKGDKLRVRISSVRNRFAVGEVVGGEQSTPTEQAEEEAPTEENEEESEKTTE